jgi:hypothetical protein
MWTVVVTVALYLFGICFFRLIGGLGAAADAMQRWGGASARRWAARRAASSS